jgi:NADPH-dependent 2,4-dienoyl-CoA reductase/sulfur reductase-like enzyme
LLLITLAAAVADTSTDRIVIVGSGLAGVTAAGTLREAGFAGELLLIGEEPELPYDRPPLSKSVLVQEGAEEQAALRPLGWYEQHRIERMHGTRVVRIDPGERSVVLENGSSVAYRKLLLVPGAHPRRLPALESGLLPHAYLRTLRDSLRLREQLRPGRRVVLLGGGVIGMEVAASALQRGCDVQVLECAPRVMGRALCASLCEHLANYHRQKGVKIALGVEVTGQALGVPGVSLRDGRVILTDLVVIGIGIIPNVELAASAGLCCDDGIIVDEFGATSVADIYAAGDAVKYPDAFHGRAIRSENWMHAQNQAVRVARNMLGEREPYRQVPHMWSDQFDLKIQVSGSHDSDQDVVRGDPKTNRFMIVHLREGRIIGASGINQARDMKFAGTLVEMRARIDPSRLADPQFNLKKAATL